MGQSPQTTPWKQRRLVGVASEELKLPKSLWAATAIPPPDCAPMHGEQTSDVCVIGAGFTGLSVALHLAEAGTAVTVLEAVEPGYGASGRNGGHFIPGWKIEPEEIVGRFGPERGPRLARCVAGSADFTYDLIQRLEIDCHARQSGWIRAAHSEAEVALGRRRAEKGATHGMKVEWLEPDRLAAITGTELYKGGLLYPSGGMLQPLSYARGLAAAGIKAGAAIHGHSPVTSVKPAAKGWQVTAPGGTVHADLVVICTNGYSDLAGGNRRLWPKLARSIVPLYSYQVATKPLSDNLRRTILPDGHAVADTRRLLAYFGLDHDGRLLMGGRGGFRESADPSDYRQVIGDLRRIFPQLGEPALDFYWGGKVAMTPDHIPHIHEPAPGVLAGLGYNGRGVAMSSLMGKLLADRALGMTAEECPLPSTKIKPIPCHGMRTPAIKLMTAWKRFRDRLDLRGS